MSLWTPGGEVPVNRDRGGAAQTPSSPPPGGPGARPAVDRSALSDEVLAEAAAAAGIDLESLSPEERAQLEEMLLEMAEAQSRLAAAAGRRGAVEPPGWLLRAGPHPPQPGSAPLRRGLAGHRRPRPPCSTRSRTALGPDGAALRDAQAQLQMAFVQLRQRYETAAGADPEA